MRYFLSVILLPWAAVAGAAISPQSDVVDISTLSQASSSPTTRQNGRSFTVNLHDDKTADAVYFNRSAETLVVCKGQAAEACRSILVRGSVEALPFDSSSILLFDRQNVPSVCTVTANERLVCSVRSLADLGAKTSTTQVPRGVYLYIRGAPDNYGCTLQPNQFALCNSARGMQPVSAGALLFGHFSGSGSLEAVQVRNGVVQLCALSSTMATCRPISGMQELVSPGASIGTIFSTTEKLSRVVLLSNTQESVCHISIASRWPAFICASATITTPSATLRPFIVTTRTPTGIAGSEKIFVAGRADELKTDSAKSAFTSTINDINRKFALSYASSVRAVGIRSQCGDWDAHSPTINPHGPASATTPAPNSGDCIGSGGGGFGFESSPEMWGYGSYSNECGGYCDGDDWWTDSFGEETLWQYGLAGWDPFDLDPIQREACFQKCIDDADTRRQYCAIATGITAGLGTIATAGAVVVFSETGPGVALILDRGISATTRVSAIVGSVCLAASLRSLQQCQGHC